MEQIKKYANRKLYHMRWKRYITLDEVARLVQDGAQVEVIDNESGADITSEILAQIVAQGQGFGRRLPTQVLVDVIRAGDEALSGARRLLWERLGGEALVDAAIVRRLERLREREVVSAEEAQRIQELLLGDEPEAPSRGSDLPTRSDVLALSSQVDALTAIVEQLLAERDAKE